MLAKTLLPLLGLLSLSAAAPFGQEKGVSHLNTFSKRSDFAEWGAGANWQITDAGNVFATFDNGVHFVLQNDGNFVVYDGNGKAVWNSKTPYYSCSPDSNGNPGNCVLAFQGDGNFVLYVNGQPKWSTNTGGKGATLLLQDTKPYIVVYNNAGNYAYTSGGAPHVPDPREPGGAAGAGGGGLGTLCREVECVVVHLPERSVV